MTSHLQVSKKTKKRPNGQQHFIDARIRETKFQMGNNSMKMDDLDKKYSKWVTMVYICQTSTKKIQNGNQLSIDGRLRKIKFVYDRLLEGK